MELRSDCLFAIPILIHTGINALIGTVLLTLLGIPDLDVHNVSYLLSVDTVCLRVVDFSWPKFI